MDIIEKFKNSQERSETDIFDLKYMSIGLGGEMGEFLNEIKKLERDDKNILTEERKKKIIYELGDIMWYYFGIIRRLDIDLNLILEENIKKLKVRNGLPKPRLNKPTPPPRPKFLKLPKRDYN